MNRENVVFIGLGDKKIILLFVNDEDDIFFEVVRGYIYLWFL